ncbi:hypothetical protein VAT7223_02602 [Vibrio atlanticus]|uniref:Uncharacterized protein n=1 Tax=Vibrio atlanticus TaxID=693153 RepID=A0A1C3IV33_9VIBR|nr:hypothetical protein VAT7223_02602 [Vibrio atlanticus]
MIISKQMHDMNILNDASALLGCSTSKELYQKLRALIERHETVRVKTGINLVAAEGPMSLQGLCCVIKFKDRTTPFRVFLNQYDKFQAYLTQ